MHDHVTVTRSVTSDGVTITETASALLPDDLTLDPGTEQVRRACLASALFRSLPSVQSSHIPPSCPPPRPPLNRPN